MLRIELTEKQREMLVGVLEKISVQGLDGMRAILEVAEKLRNAVHEPETKEKKGGDK